MDDLDGVARRPVLTEPYVLVVPRGYETATDTAFPRLVQDLPLVRWSSHSNIGLQIEQHLRRMRVEVPRRFEFESAGSILGMVASGLGCAIMTPLLMFELKDVLSQVRVLPFPGPSFTRHIDLVTRLGEIDQIADRICQMTCSILREQYLPAMTKAIPAIKEKIVVGRAMRG
jgi:DNA-binding transcriptional LysR family regulator